MSDLADELNLRSVGSWDRDFARHCFRLRRMDQFVSAVDVTQYSPLAIVVDNVELLRSCGHFESALVYAYLAGGRPHASTSTKLLSHLFRLGDRTRMRKLGHPLPHAGSFQLYRGVAGVHQHRRIRGLAWTDSLERACWYARRFGDEFADPGVYVATVAEPAIYYYRPTAQGGEFIAWPGRYRRLPLADTQIRSAALQVRR